MKSPDISPNQPLLSVEDENDVELFSTQKLPSVGRMAGRYDVFTWLRRNLDSRTI